MPHKRQSHNKSLLSLPFWQRALSHVNWLVVSILVAVIIAAVLPASGSAAEALKVVVTIAIAGLFFLYGVRLETRQALNALKNWKLHSVIFACTYLIFPLLGLLCLLIPDSVIDAELQHGLLFMTLLPSTVQSSIVFVSIAKGNVAGAVVSASLSNLLGVVITPLLVALTLSNNVGFDASAMGKIALQVLLPFIVGQLVRRWCTPWVTRHTRFTMLCDRGAIVLVVYSAFSQGVVDGMWSRVSVGNILTLMTAALVILIAMLTISHTLGKRLGFSRADQATILMCGSKKSLATGVPIATVIFSAGAVGIMVLPLMIFHQIQLIVCAALARRLAHTAPPHTINV
ncbi:bile acid:sodium symporter family protein [Timonella sp. A28]|uniref:bile acid:sodium symporter family protein n=1 Tax=Timonella sp. A28 TaxID=3442640 RepID=UPI003EBC2B76